MMAISTSFYAIATSVVQSLETMRTLLVPLWHPDFIYVKPGIYIWVQETGLSLVFIDLVSRVPPMGKIVGEIFPTPFRR